MRIISTILLLLITCWSIFPQQKSNFYNLSLNEGLAHPDVLSVIEDKNGYLWVGTRNGLQRYDGFQFRTFTVQDTLVDPIGSNIIQSIDTIGNYLWIDTPNKIYLFNTITCKYESYTTTGAKLPDHIIDISTSAHGEIWLASLRKVFHGVYDSVEQELQIKRMNISRAHNDFPKDIYVKQISSKQQNNVWVLMSRGYLLKVSINSENEFEITQNLKTPLNALKFTFYKEKLYMLANDAFYIYTFRKNQISLEHKFNLAQLFANQAKTFSNSNILLRNFHIEAGENIWITSTQGLLQLYKENNNNYLITIHQRNKNHSNSITSNDLYNISYNNNDILWIGTHRGGLCYMDKKEEAIQYFDYSFLNNKILHPIRSFYALNDNRLILGSDIKGVYLKENEKVLQPKNEMPDMGKVTGLVPINRDTIWVGAEKGIFLLEPNTMQLSPIQDILTSTFTIDNRITSIAKDRFNNIWTVQKKNILNCFIRNSTGKYRVDTINLKSNSASHEIERINSITPDLKQNEILLACASGIYSVAYENNLSSYESVKLLKPNEQSTVFPSKNVLQIEQRNDSVYYVLVQNEGVFELTRPHISSEQYDAKQIWANNVRYGNMILQGEWLYLTSNKIEAINLRSHEVKSINIQLVGRHDYIIGHAKHTHNNKLYLGTSSGYLIVDTDKLKISASEKKAYLTKIAINNIEQHELFSPSGKLLFNNAAQPTELKHYQNNLMFGFTSPNLSSFSHSYYMYRLKGLNNEWNGSSKNRVSYQNLPPGKYIFQVSFNPTENKHTSNFSFTIKAPFWQTWGFIALIIFSVLLLGFVILYYTLRWFRIKSQMKVLDEMNKLKLQFFTNITHELKTPLSLIISPAEELTKKSFSPDISGKVNLINENAKHLLKLVNELLEFRKSETVKGKLKVEELNLSAFINNEITRFKELASTSNKLLEVYSDADDIKVWTDTGRLSKVLNNLISNAIKHTEKGGIINIKLYHDARQAEHPWPENIFQVGAKYKTKCYAGIQISDNGIGISENSLPHIFDRFYQVESSEKKHLGAGVGLAIVKNMIQRIHGQLVVSSKRKEGTSFLIKLPYGKDFIKQEDIITSTNIQESKPTPYANTAEIKLNGNSKPKLLIVEDNSELRDYLSTSLQSRFSITLAINGYEGLKFTYDLHPDLIISDVMMPKMNGMDMCRKIKEDINVNHIPVILLTAKTSDDSISEGYYAGADRYIPKPFSLQVIEANINSLLRNIQIRKEKFKNTSLLKVNSDSEHNPNDEFTDSILSVIKKEADDSSFNVEVLCDLMHMSNRNLQLKLKAILGVTPQSLIRNTRLEKAAIMLSESSESVANIAYACGFSSPSHFGKCFKEKYNCTPKQFIESL